MPSLRQRFLDNPYLLHATATAVSMLLMFTRRPDAFLNPQFWAEDGLFWYSQAYNHGIVYSLLRPEGGYYQTASRLVAIIAQLFPFAYGPAIFNLGAMLAKVLVVNFLISSRCANVVPSVAGRLAIAFIYLALPHSYETHANLTNVQWHLALLSFLIVVSSRSDKLTWRVFDYAVVALSALSGPLCLLLAPIAAIRYFIDRKRSTLILTSIFVLGGLIQMSALLTTERPSGQPLGADFGLGMKIIAGHLFISAILGEQGHGYAIKRSILNDVTAVVINLAGFALLVYAFVRSRLELRLMIVFSVMIFCTAMMSPAITDDFPQWTIMWLPAAGSRYWLIPIFCFLVTLLYLANADHRPVRFAAALALIVSLAGIAGDWRYPKYRDLDFQSHAERLESAAPGEEVVIPINPDWEMRLTKK